MTSLGALTLLRPEALLLLLLVPVFAWIALRGRRPRAGEVAAVAARSLLLLTVSLALALPRIESQTRFRAVAFVLDISDSIPRAALDDAKEFVRRSASARPEEDDASFLVFADGAAVEAPMARVSATVRGDTVPIDPKNVSTRIPTGESDLQTALELARAGFPPGGARSVVLLTDGNETRNHALDLVQDLTAEGVSVWVVPVRYRRENEVWVEKVVAPALSPENAPVPVRAVVRNSGAPGRGRLRCLVDGSEVRAEDVDLDTGANTFQFGVPFAVAGFHRVEVVVEPGADGDPVNNRGAAATFVRGKGRVLLASNVEQGSPLAGTLAANLDLEVDAGGPSDLPTDPAGWVPYDCVVLENVPAWKLSDTQKRVLRSAVEDLGVGLVCVGGPEAYGPGGYGGSEIETVLPVTSDVKNRRVLPGGALVVALHSCEFPDGNAIGREVTRLAIKALSAEDEMGLIEFAMDGTDQWVIPLSVVGSKDRHLAQVAKAEPSDAPSLHSILKAAADALEKSHAAARHIIVISDGDPQPPDDRLVTRLRDDLRVTVTTVCVDPHTIDGPSAMKRVAEATGGNAYHISSKDRDRLPQIFIKEAVTVRRSAWSEEPFLPTLRGVHRMVHEFGPDSFPPLQGHTVTTPRPEAEQILSGPEDDPILATWQHGLGRATAWTADATPRWAPEWVSWEGYSKFWVQVVRASLRSVERPTARAQIELDGGQAHVVLDALRDDGEFDDGLRVEGRAVGPDGTARPFRLRQTGPGRYEGAFPAPEVGTHLATLTWADPSDPTGGTTAQVQAAVCVAYSAEHLAQGSNERLFAAMEAAGARLLDVEALDREALQDPKKDPALVPWSGEAAATEESLELWPWLAGIAALVLVTDVAVRRLRIDWRKLLPKRSALPAKAKPEGKVATGAAKAPAAGAFDPNAGAGAPVQIAGSASPKPETPQSPPPAAPASGGGDLLSAKRRAKRKQTWEENRP